MKTVIPRRKTYFTGLTGAAIAVMVIFAGVLVLQHETHVKNAPAAQSASKPKQEMVLTVLAHHQVYSLKVPRNVDRNSFQYIVLKNGIVWVRPLPLQNPQRQSYRGASWDIYFTSFHPSGQSFNLMQGARLQAEIPNYLGGEKRQNFVQFAKTNGYVVVTAIFFLMDSAEFGQTTAYYLNENTAHPKLTKIASYQENGGGEFARTLVTDRYFMWAQMDPFKVVVKVYNFANGKTYTIPNDIAKHGMQWPTFQIKNNRLTYTYLNGQVTSEPIP